LIFALPLRYLSAFLGAQQAWRIRTNRKQRFPDQSNSFPPLLTVPVKRHLVSVLDLDNSVSFSACRHVGRPEETAIHMLAAPEGLAQD